MKTFIKDDSGMSSVLIVIMMIVLMIFGLAGLTLAMSNGRLADKKIDWLKDYYALEGDANTVIAQIDDAVKDAMTPDDIIAAIDTLNQHGDVDIAVSQDDGDMRLSFTVAKDGEYQKYIDVELSVQIKKYGDVHLVTERFIERQTAFEYEDIFQFE